MVEEKFEKEGVIYNYLQFTCSKKPSCDLKNNCPYFMNTLRNRSNVSVGQCNT